VLVTFTNRRNDDEGSRRYVRDHRVCPPARPLSPFRAPRSGCFRDFGSAGSGAILSASW
jgi:hypothetical protein